MVTVTAKLKAKQGEEEKMESLLREVITKVSAEEGTLLYALHKTSSDPTQFLFYEQYKDMDALGVHSTTPHFKQMMTDLAPLLDGKPVIELWEEVARA